MRFGIVLGGGRSSRMGFDKMSLDFDGVPLLERTVRAVEEWAEVVVVVAPRKLEIPRSKKVLFTLEDPPFGGPVAGIEAGLNTLLAHTQIGAHPRSTVMVLAGDLAWPDAAVSELRDTKLGADGAILVDLEGRDQYLAGIYRYAPLRGAIGVLETARNQSLVRLMRGLSLKRIAANRVATHDLDDPESLKEVGTIVETKGT